MEGSRDSWDDIHPNVIKEMESRLDDMKSGKDSGYTWEEAKAILLNEIKDKKSADA